MSLTRKDIERLRKWIEYCQSKFNGQRLDSFYREMSFEKVLALLDRLDALERMREAVLCLELTPEAEHTWKGDPIVPSGFYRVSGQQVLSVIDALSSCPALEDGEEKRMNNIEKGCTFNHRDGFPEQELFELKQKLAAKEAELATWKATATSQHRLNLELRRTIDEGHWYAPDLDAAIVHYNAVAGTEKKL